MPLQKTGGRTPRPKQEVKLTDEAGNPYTNNELILLGRKEYVKKEGEENTVVVMIEQEQFVDGDRISKPELMKINIRQWNLWIQANGGKWTICKVLNMPEGAIAPETTGRRKRRL